MRVSSKLVVLDPLGRVLLLDCVDPGAPGTTWWELPGGGVEPGEDEVTAAVREVLEETGIAVPAEAVGPLQWVQVAAFTWRGRRHLARHEGRVARLDSAPTPSPPALTGPEQGSLLGQRWWTLAEVAAHDGRFFPRNLPSLLPRLVAGERVDEPYDDWDLPRAPAARPALVPDLGPSVDGVVRRRAARVLLVDAEDRVLLLRGTDPVERSREWWFTPGGGLDEGEEPLDAARRELAEETGLHLPPEAFGPVVHARVAEFTFAGVRCRQDEVYFLARVDRHEVDHAGFTALEVQSVLDSRWWPREELLSTAETVYPAELADVLARALVP